MTKNYSKSQLVMPIHSSPLGQGPHPMELAEMMIIECKADKDELVRITPSMCDPSDSQTVKVFFTNNRQPPNSIAFTEAGIIQEVIYRGEPSTTIPYIWVSDDMAMLGGRELYGMPKLLMDNHPLEIHSNQIFGQVARAGVVVLQGSMVLERQLEVSESPYKDNLPSVFERHVPNPNPELPSLRQLIRLKIQDRELLDNLWFGRGHIEIHHPLTSCLDLLHLETTGRAWYGKFRWSLPFGEIIEENFL
ncbi:MAG: acetoacetate decarboxylase family protein [Pseudomonadota bacterium]|nr:acetoacetate decarboxylase family protein [Pseudomonadota bacterium]